MSSLRSPTRVDDAPDPNLPAVIERAERRRGMLEELSEVGMALAKNIAERAIDAPHYSELRHDPGRSFANISRAVRLTLVLEAKVEKYLLALCNGGVTIAGAASGGRPAEVASAPSSPVATFKEASCSVRAKALDAVREAIDREIGDGDDARAARGRLHDRLLESEDYEALLSRPWRECVAAICEDLGLSPDWTLLSDEAGFANADPDPASHPKSGAQCSAFLLARSEERGSCFRGESGGGEPISAAPRHGPP